jgi:DNA-binding transcriptional regulator YdaS (Cro superfamily)
MSAEEDSPLALYLRSRNIPYWEFAERIGVSENSVANYIKGRRIPPLPIVLKIEDATGGKVNARNLNDFYQTRKRNRSI